MCGMRGITEAAGRIILQCRRRRGRGRIAAGGHEVVITCMGLRKRRASRFGQCCCHASAFSPLCRTTTRAALNQLGPHESWHSVPHGAVLSGTHPYPCNYSLYAKFCSASRTRRKTQLHAALALAYDLFLFPNYGPTCL